MAYLGQPTLLRRLLLLLLSILLSTYTSPASAARPIRDIRRPTRVSAVPSTKPPSPQLGDIIGILIGAKEFNAWANLLATSSLSSLPPSATLFVPSDVAVARSLPFDGSTIAAYHIVPRALSYRQLQLLDVGSRLPTLFSNHTIVVTDNLAQNLTIDRVTITDPDLYVEGDLAVHGVGSVLSPSFSDDGLPQDSIPGIEATASGSQCRNWSFSSLKKFLHPLLPLPNYSAHFLKYLFGGLPAEEL